MKDTGLHDGVYIDVMIPGYTLDQYDNTEYINEYYYPLMNSKCQHQTTHQFLHILQKIVIQQMTKYVHYKFH